MFVRTELNRLEKHLSDWNTVDDTPVGSLHRDESNGEESDEFADAESDEGSLCHGLDVFTPKVWTQCGLCAFMTVVDIMQFGLCSQAWHRTLLLEAWSRFEFSHVVAKFSEEVLCFLRLDDFIEVGRACMILAAPCYEFCIYSSRPTPTTSEQEVWSRREMKHNRTGLFYDDRGHSIRSVNDLSALQS